MKSRRLRIGVAGLGRAFVLMLPTLKTHPGVEIVGSADPRKEARDRFASEFRKPTFETVEELCQDPEVEAVYVATPHQFHAQHVITAAQYGKHILVEKPMALTIEECQRMVEAAHKSAVKLIVGPSHSFDRPIGRVRELIDSNAFGKVRSITALNFTDFLYRPRRPEELVTDHGGGVVFSQAAHQVDIVRLLASSKIRSVWARSGTWDLGRPTEGSYAAILNFEDGCFASLSYSGYGYFDSDEFCNWITESGEQKDPSKYGSARELLKQNTSTTETALKNSRAYGSTDSSIAFQPFHNHFGVFIVSCDHGDLRPLPNGVMIYGDTKYLEKLESPAVPRSEVLDELCEAVIFDRSPIHSGSWGMATLEVCLSILRSSKEMKEITLRHQ